MLSNPTNLPLAITTVSGRVDEALAAYVMAAKLNPSLDQQHFIGPTHNRAHLLLTLGRDTEAAEAFEDLVSM